MTDFERWIISLGPLDRDVRLLQALTDQDSDIQAWGATVLMEMLQGRDEVAPHPLLNQFIDALVDDEMTSFQIIMLSRFFETNHPWIAEYLSERLRVARTEDEVSKITNLFYLFHKLGTLSSREAIPPLIESLEKATIAHEAIPDIITKLENADKELDPEFVQSSYEWNIKSAYLEWERWMSLMGIAGTLLYAFALGLVASFSIPGVIEQVPGVSERIFLLAGAVNLSAFTFVAFLFAWSGYQASETEKRLQPRLEISREFLSKRKELKTQIIDHYVSFLEKKHEKWRNILNTVIRLYLTIALSSVVALLFGRLPIDVMQILLGVMTLLFLVLSVLAYKKMKNIEEELIQKQKMLRVYYGK